LPYIAALGVDGIWMTPFQPSPQVDQGYDMTDYCGVDPLFGTMEQFESLLAKAHALGLRILLDVVPNHCSSEHPLFQQALAAGPGSPERDMFHFVGGSGADVPPNNWQSVFGGRAWSRANPDSETDKDWYLHLFSAGQPDWNWRNPAVGDYFDGVLRFWFDKGVDGLRIDVAHALFKADGLPDSPSTGGVVDGLRSNPQVSDQEDVHEVYRRWRTLAEKYEPHRLLVGEVNLEPARAARYTRADEMQQAFAFAFVKLGWDPEAWAAVGNELEAARQLHGAAPTWALENHDIVRSVTRFGGGDLGSLRARRVQLGNHSIFPNGILGLRLALPRGPLRTEFWHFVLVDRDAPDEIKRALRIGSQANNGAAGMFEQDDVDNWRQVSAASTSRLGRRHPQDLSMGLGHAGPHPDYPGLVSERYISENNQRLFYRRWEEFMNAASWADIPLAPITAPFPGTATLRG